jgi:hypothetical protein
MTRIVQTIPEPSALFAESAAWQLGFNNKTQTPISPMTRIVQSYRNHPRYSRNPRHGSWGSTTTRTPISPMTRIVQLHRDHPRYSRNPRHSSWDSTTNPDDLANHADRSAAPEPPAQLAESATGQLGVHQQNLTPISPYTRIVLPHRNHPRNSRNPRHGIWCSTTNPADLANHADRSAAPEPPAHFAQSAAQQLEFNNQT